MKRPKMQMIGTVVWMLLQMASAYSISGLLSEDAIALIRAKRSTTCNKETVNNFISSVGETCPNIKSVDDYIANLNSKQTIAVPSSNDDHGFKDIITHYNIDLQEAKEKCKPWRNGDSIFGSITQMVTAAKEFEPKFNREFEQNQVRVKNIIENHEDIGAVEDKIAALQVEIREAQEAIKLSPVPNVKTHLEKLIKRKEEEINNIRQDHEVLQARRELGELIKYLEFVRDDSTQIRTKAESARSKISQFRTNIVSAAGVFNRHRKSSKAGITRLNQEKDNNNRELTNIQKEKDKLNKKIREERAQITSLNNQIRQAKRDLENTERDIANSEKKAKKKKKIGGFITVLVPVVGWIAGPALSNSAKKRLRELADQKRAFISEHTKEVQNLQSQIDSSTRHITQLQTRISSHMIKACLLEAELQLFNQLDGKLESVESEATSILPKITSAIAGTDSMRNTFDAIKRNLDDTIKKANESKTAAEIRNISHFIYGMIDQLKCEWNEVHGKIVSVGQCKGKPLQTSIAGQLAPSNLGLMSSEEEKCRQQVIDTRRPQPDGGSRSRPGAVGPRRPDSDGGSRSRPPQSGGGSRSRTPGYASVIGPRRSQSGGGSRSRPRGSASAIASRRPQSGGRSRSRP